MLIIANYFFADDELSLGNFSTGWDMKNMNYWLLSIFYFLFSLGIGSFQFLNLYYVDFGLTNGQIGVLFAIGPLVMIFSQPFWGLLTDYLNTPKTTLFTMLIGSAGIALIFPFANSYSYLIVLNIAYFFFQSSVPPIADATTLALLKERNDFGKVRLWGSFGYAVGVMVIGSLLDVFGLKLMFILHSSILVLTLLLIMRLPIQNGRRNQFSIKEAIFLFRNPSFVLILLFSFLVYLPAHANNSFYTIYLQNIGATITIIGFSLLIKAILEIPFFAMSNKLMSRFSYPGLLTFAALIYGLRWLIIGTTDHLQILVWSQVLLSLSYTIQYFVSVKYVDLITPIEYRATGQAFYWTVTLGVGGLLGNVLAGWVLKYIEIPQMYQFAVVISLLSIILLWIKPIEKLEHTE